MKKYRVNVLSLAGNGNKIFSSGDIVTDRNLRHQNIDRLSKNIEFSYELISVLPYAYWLHKNNNLRSTHSSFDTKCLYYFSPYHTENSEKRSFNNTFKVKYPNIKIHKPYLDMEFFEPPPLKDYYKNNYNAFNFDKPIICICNRVTSEWLGDPINFFDNDCIDKLFSMLKKKYEIIYFNIKGKVNYYDDQIPIETGEEKIIKKHKVKTIVDLHEENKHFTFNECQLLIMANCEHFITMNGGYSLMAAYMGGTNIIYSKKCQEIEPKNNSFYRWFHKFGNQRILHVNNYSDLFLKVKEIMVKENPVINILIRTSGRPNYFKECIESVYKQTYQNYNIIVGCDDDESVNYVQPNKCRLVRYEKGKDNLPAIKNNPEYGIAAPYNLYMNELHKEVTEGFILYLDDDDCLQNENSLKEIADNLKSENDILFFRIQFPNNRVVPSDSNFGKPPVLCDIDTVGFCFHHKYAVSWEGYKRGDYRVAKKLYETIPNKIYLNKILTKINRKVANGFGRRDDI